MHTKHAVVLSYTDTTALFPSDVSTVSAPETPCVHQLGQHETLSVQIRQQLFRS